MLGGGYQRDESSEDLDTDSTEAERTRGFSLSDEDLGDKFVVAVGFCALILLNSDEIHRFHGIQSSTPSSLQRSQAAPSARTSQTPTQENKYQYNSCHLAFMLFTATDRIA